jgi:Flp pilus assembly protein TadG
MVGARCRTSNERGQSLVEVAFVVPVLLLLMVALIEIGRFAYYSVLVSNAAHAGAQYGAQSLITSGDDAGVTNAAQQDGLPTMAVQRHQSCGCDSAHLVNCPAAGGGCTNPLVYVEVTVTQTINSMFHWPGIPQQMDLSSTVKMRVSQ